MVLERSLLVVALALLPAVAVAGHGPPAAPVPAPTPAPTPAAGPETETARAHFEKASAAFALGTYSEAAVEYEKAFALKPQPALLYDAAQAHRLAGEKKRALELYQNYLRVYGQTAPNRVEVEGHARDLEAAIAADEAAKKLSPEAVAQATQQLPAVDTRPLVKRPLFWGAVAGGVAVVAAIVIIAVVASSGNSDPTASLGKISGTP